MRLNKVSLEVKDGEFVAVMGPSGCGKSTLLNILGLLDNPSEGNYYLGDQEVGHLKEKERTQVRKGNIGFVFQSFNLIDELNVFENVELPLMYNAAIGAKEREERAVKALQAVGLGGRLYHKSNQDVGADRCNVWAIARALVNDPAVILADEATGNLDTRTSFEILILFQSCNAAGRTIIFVTHNPDIANYSSRNIMLRDGHVIATSTTPTYSRLKRDWRHCRKLRRMNLKNGFKPHGNDKTWLHP